MKKFGIFVIIVIIAFGIAIKIVTDHKIKQKKMNEVNKLFDVYEKEITTNELITIINKAIDLNDQNLIKEDENEYYIENTENSIKIDVKFLQNDDLFKIREWDIGSLFPGEEVPYYLLIDKRGIIINKGHIEDRGDRS